MSALREVQTTFARICVLFSNRWHLERCSALTVHTFRFRWCASDDVVFVLCVVEVVVRVCVCVHLACSLTAGLCMHAPKKNAKSESIRLGLIPAVLCGVSGRVFVNLVSVLAVGCWIAN